jgi:DUF971 family protein
MPSGGRLAEPAVIPKAVRRRGEILEITWDDQGHVGSYSTRALRLACPCAACVDEMSGRPLLDPATVPEQVEAVALVPVGAYGLRIHWSDGHATGIYSWQALRASCPCADCRGGGA